MPKARVNSTVVSLTEDELKKIESLYRVAWGSSFNPNRTQQKLSKALERIKAQQVAQNKE